MVSECLDSDCVSIIGRNTLCRVLVRCAVLSLQQHNHYRSQRLVRLFYCKKLVCFNSGHYAVDQVVVETNKEPVRRGRLIRFSNCHCRRTLSWSFGNLFLVTPCWFAHGFCCTSAWPWLSRRSRKLPVRLHCLERHMIMV